MFLPDFLLNSEFLCIQSSSLKHSLFDWKNESLHWKYPVRHISKFLNFYWFVATLIDIITHRFLITLFQIWKNTQIALMGVFNVKIRFFNQIRSVSDSILHGHEDCMLKNSKFSRKSDKIDYGQVHLYVINKICPFCAAVNFFHVYDLLLQDLYRKYI